MANLISDKQYQQYASDVLEAVGGVFSRSTQLFGQSCIYEHLRLTVQQSDNPDFINDKAVALGRGVETILQSGANNEQKARAIYSAMFDYLRTGDNKFNNTLVEIEKKQPGFMARKKATFPIDVEHDDIVNAASRLVLGAHELEGASAQPLTDKQIAR